MKTLKLALKELLIVAMVLMFITSMAQEKDNLITKSKEIIRDFDKTSIAELFITNNFGNINISSWSKNYMEMKIMIQVTGWEEEDVDIFINQISPTLYHKNSYVSSTINSKHIKNSCCPDVKKVYKPWFSKNAEVKHFSINYEIKIPKSMIYLQLLNAYGNISLPSYSGKLIINLRNGNLKTGNLDVESCECPGINVRYGKVNMGKVSNGVFKFYSCDMVKIASLNNTILTTSFSNIELGSVSGVNLKSKSDVYVINNLNSLNGSGQFTTMSISRLGSHFKFSNNSGDIIIKSINPDFERIFLSGQYNHYSLSVANLSYLFSAKLESTELICGEDICSNSFKNEALTGSITFNKKIGINSNEFSKISLECSKCNIDLISE